MPPQTSLPYTSIINGKLTFKRRFPKPCHGHPALGGKVVYQRSLRTMDKEVAMRRHAGALAEFDAICTAATSPQGPAAPALRVRRSTSISDDEIAYLARAKWEAIVREDRQLRERSALEDEDGPNRTYLEDVRDYQFEHERERYEKLTRRDGSLVALAVKSTLRKLGVEAPEAHPKFEALCSAFIDAELDALRTIDMHREGRFGLAPQVSLLRNAPTKNPFEVPLLLDFAEKYIEDTNPSEDWAEKIRYATKLLAEYSGNRRIDVYTRAEVAEWCTWLRKVPTNVSMRFSGMSIADAIAANQKRQKPVRTLSPGTIQNGYKAAIGRLFEYAVNLDLIHKSPAQRIKISGYKKNASGRPPFTKDELDRLFQQPVFIGCRSPKHPNTAGEYKLNNHYYWAPIIALFTGARAAELAQILLDEIDVASQHPHMLIQTDMSEDADEDILEEFGDDGRKLKNDNAIRQIPLHPELERLGFFDYVKQLRDAGEQRLFPEWKRGSKGFSGASSQKNFNKIIRKSVSARRPAPVFHSLRHNVRSEMVIRGVRSFHRNAILGHEQSPMDRAYVGQSIDVGYLYEAVCAVTHNSLDLSHLYPDMRFSEKKKS